MSHPGGSPQANLRSIAHRYYLREVACEWELAEETIYLPLSCLQGGYRLGIYESVVEEEEEVVLGV